jgi:hypothetical protein
MFTYPATKTHKDSPLLQKHIFRVSYNEIVCKIVSFSKFLKSSCTFYNIEIFFNPILQFVNIESWLLLALAAQ